MYQQIVAQKKTAHDMINEITVVQGTHSLYDA